MLKPRAAMMMLLLSLFSCDTDVITDTNCRSESDPEVTLYFNLESCEIVDYECIGNSVVYEDACGCGCLLKEDD